MSYKSVTIYAAVDTATLCSTQGQASADNQLTASPFRGDLWRITWRLYAHESGTTAFAVPRNAGLEFIATSTFGVYDDAQVLLYAPPNAFDLSGTYPVCTVDTNTRNLTTALGTDTSKTYYAALIMTPPGAGVGAASSSSSLSSESSPTGAGKHVTLAQFTMTVKNDVWRMGEGEPVSIILRPFSLQSSSSSSSSSTAAKTTSSATESSASSPSSRSSRSTTSESSATSSSSRVAKTSSSTAAESTSSQTGYSTSSSHEGELTLLDEIAASAEVRGVDWNGTTLQTAQVTNGLKTYSVAGSGALALLDADDRGGYYMDVTHNGTHTFVARRSASGEAGGVTAHTIDGSGNISAPISNLRVVDQNEKIHAQGNYVYCGSQLNGVLSYSAFGGTLVHVDTENRGGQHLGVFHDGAFLYAVSQTTDVRSHSTAAGAITYADTGGATTLGTGVWSDGTYVFVACSGNGLYAFSVDGAGSLTYVTHAASHAGNYADVWGDGEFIYVACNAGGLAVYEFDGAALSLVTTAREGSQIYHSVHGDGSGKIFCGTNTSVLCYGARIESSSSRSSSSSTVGQSTSSTTASSSSSTEARSTSSTAGQSTSSPSSTSQSSRSSSSQTVAQTTSSSSPSSASSASSASSPSSASSDSSESSESSASSPSSSSTLERSTSSQSSESSASSPSSASSESSSTENVYFLQLENESGRVLTEDSKYIELE